MEAGSQVHGGGEQVNNGTYKSGFATSQAAYDLAQQELYAALDALEARLARHRFLVGDRCAPPSLVLLACKVHMASDGSLDACYLLPSDTVPRVATRTARSVIIMLRI
jgi:hypothetical protein